jgi:hypothetical protein
MRKILLYILPAILSICLLNACKKGFADKQSVPVSEHPDLVSTIRMSVAGFITNENGEAMFNATITAGSKSASTDAYGYFKIDDVSLSKTAGFIKISKAGYFDGYRSFVGIENKETFIRSKLVPKVNIGTISATSGGSANTTDGGVVALPANAVVNANTNTVYTGTVHVAAYLFKQNNISEWSSTIPGDNRGISSEGYLEILQSYGMMAVELTGDAGELLQIATGKEATITTPIPASLVASAPGRIALWSFDVTKGLWKQESTTTKNGNTYSGKVSHFSFWDGAVGVPLVNLTVQIVNSALQPLGGVPVYVYTANDSTATIGYTNTQGIVSGAVPANTALVLKVYKTCNNAGIILSQNFNTSSSNIDLGTISADLGDQVFVSGSVVNCNNQPVNNGYVSLSLISGASINGVVVPVTNGSFSFPVAVCSNTNASYVAIDNDTHLQGTAQTITITPGVNNLGTLTACGHSSVAVFNYRIDNGPWANLSVPTDIMYSLFANDVSGNTWIVVSCNSVANTTNTPDLQMSINPPDISGNRTIASLQSTSFLGPSYGATPTAPIVVMFTETGQINDFIAGSFSGTVEDNTDHSQHTVECNFRVRRIQ